MRDKKRRYETFSFYDHTGIEKHLEKMAQEGWLIEKIDFAGWRYRRIEPKKLHFCVTYYPRASEFDPGPSEAQETFYDFCAHTGWTLAAVWAQMQIFCNEREDPIPIETDPELEVEHLHRSAKKSYLPGYFLFSVVALLSGVSFIGGLLFDPIRQLSNSTGLFTGFCFLDLLVLCAVELFVYFRWHGRAKKAAARGEFLPSPSTRRFQAVSLAVMVIALVLWLLDLVFKGDQIYLLSAGAMLVVMASLILITNGIKMGLKRAGAPRGLNFGLTMAACVILPFILMSVTVFGLIRAVQAGVLRTEQTYEYRGAILPLYLHQLPLTVEDLLDVHYDGYIRHQTGSDSVLLGQFEMYQRPRLDAEQGREMPRLSYTITQVKASFLYDLCKSELLKPRWVGEEEYLPVDAAAWGAVEAYQRNDMQFGPENTWLLCYPNRIVEIEFTWTPTAEQMALAGERLRGETAR